MIRRAPPFEGYTLVASDQMWASVLKGEMTPHVYSSEAMGDFTPVAISAAELFRADEAARNEEGDLDPALQPFQVMWRDRDRRRSVAKRRAIPIPHWVYVATSHASGKVDEQFKPSRRRASKEEIRAELRAVYATVTKPPNIKEVPKLVQPRIHGRGLEASGRYIAKIAEEPEFANARRPAGKTIASERKK